MFYSYYLPTTYISLSVQANFSQKSGNSNCKNANTLEGLNKAFGSVQQDRDKTDTRQRQDRDKTAVY